MRSFSVFNESVTFICKNAFLRTLELDEAHLYWAWVEFMREFYLRAHWLNWYSKELIISGHVVDLGGGVEAQWFALGMVLKPIFKGSLCWINSFFFFFTKLIFSLDKMSRSQMFTAVFFCYFSWNRACLADSEDSKILSNQMSKRLKLNRCCMATWGQCKQLKTSDMLANISVHLELCLCPPGEL